MSDDNEKQAAPAGDDRHLTGKPLGRIFWILCSMEMWERLAYYGMRVVVPIYIAQADEPGGLHFTQEQKGSIYAWWFVFQSVLPTFTGGFADRYGYKNTIFWAINLKVIGYVLMATQRTYWGFFIGTMLLATGTAIFKPGIQGSLAQSLDKGNSSKGWGTFYWLVNVGAMIGPPLAGYLRGKSWDWVFYGCAAIVSLNYLMMFTYRDPESGYAKKDSFGRVFVVTLKNLFDARLATFLLILSGFWLMMYQLWDLQPNFIVDWNDSSRIAPYLPSVWTHETDRGIHVLQENLLNLNAFLIVVFIVPVSIMVRKMRTLSAMLGGMIMATFGVLIAGVTMSGAMLLFGIFFFSAGEMLTGPKKNEYLALIAPHDKKGLYLGYVNIPVGIGGFVGSKLAGYLYGNFGEKAVLAQRYLAEKTDYLAENGRPAWNGEVASLGDTLGVPRKEAYDTLKSYLDLSGHDATELLWTTYEPYHIWYYFAAIGVASTLALLVYNQRAKRWGHLNQ
jgi:POT family proton-dependent oligopeptide transporter